MISDSSVGELLDFATRIKLPMRWFQARASIPHFDLSPGWRAKAIAAGAVAADRREFVEGGRRWRSNTSSS